MNFLLEVLWNGFELTEAPEDRQLERTRQKLYEQLSAAVSEDFTQKIRDVNFKIEDLYARQVFQRGLCLGGQLVLALLGEDLTRA